MAGRPMQTRRGLDRSQAVWSAGPVQGPEERIPRRAGGSGGGGADTAHEQGAARRTVTRRLMLSVIDRSAGLAGFVKDL